MFFLKFAKDQSHLFGKAFLFFRELLSQTETNDNRIKRIAEMQKQNRATRPNKESQTVGTFLPFRELCPLFGCLRLGGLLFSVSAFRPLRLMRSLEHSLAHYYPSSLAQAPPMPRGCIGLSHVPKGMLVQGGGGGVTLMGVFKFQSQSVFPVTDPPPRCTKGC